MQYISKKQHKDFIFVTFTAPNVPGDKLRDELTRLNKGFHKLLKLDAIEKMNHGFIRKMEITYNDKRDDYHPNMHCVFAVTRGYFSGGRYIRQAQWLNMWRDVLNQPEITQVDARRVKKTKGDDGVSRYDVAEFAKYVAKDEDYTRSQEQFDVFYGALRGRKSLTYGGLFAEANAMYKDGELDDFIQQDMTEYYWNLMYSWAQAKEDYSEERKHMLTAMDRRLVENRGIRVDKEVPKIKVKLYKRGSHGLHVGDEADKDGEVGR
jgi:hypothetical protein